MTIQNSQCVGSRFLIDGRGSSRSIKCLCDRIRISYIVLKESLFVGARIVLSDLGNIFFSPIGTAANTVNIWELFNFNFQYLSVVQSRREYGLF